MNRIQRCLSVVATLGGALFALVVAAPAALATPPPPDPNPAYYVPPPVVHTVVTGFMPGWQIALIAVVASVVTVRAERAWSARRPAATPARPGT
jgi:hypothetical protein